ncbi:hypothetical protein A6R68_18669, partial [Neotoma lepida]
IHQLCAERTLCQLVPLSRDARVVQETALLHGCTASTLSGISQVSSSRFRQDSHSSPSFLHQLDFWDHWCVGRIESLMDRGAIVRNLENLGERALPYKISSHGQQHSRGGYFLVDFYAPTSAVESILDHLTRDIDVVRPNVVKHPLTQEVKECGGIVPVPLEEKLYLTRRRKK